MEHTTEDFWTMVIERNVSVIVMATPLNLRGLVMLIIFFVIALMQLFIGTVLKNT